MAEWISVKDRLPDNSDPVLVCARGGKGAREVFGGVRYDAKAKRWIFPLSKITHWMPFPDPPTEET